MAANRQSLIENRQWTTDSPEETRALGRRLGARLERGSVVALYGELGTGKTQLAKGVAGALGIDEADVRSPTFVLLREYEGRAPGGDDGAPLPFYHFDAYRLSSPEELRQIGAEDYFFGDGVCLVEWAERAEALLPPDALRLRLEHRGGDRRLIAWMNGGMGGRRNG